jgi:DNA/RNA endonuclease YhcR with UshA esterase domain
MEVTGLVEEYKGRPQIVIGLPVQVKVIAAFLAELSGLPNVAAPNRRNSCS